MSRNYETLESWLETASEKEVEDRWLTLAVLESHLPGHARAWAMDMLDKLKKNLEKRRAIR